MKTSPGAQALSGSGPRIAARDSAISFGRLFLLFFALVTVAGCCLGGKSLEQVSPPPWNESPDCAASPRELYGRAVSAFYSLESLEAQASVRFEADGALNRTVSAVVLYKAPRSVRVDLYSRWFGAVGTWIASDDTFIVFDAQKGVYYEAGDPGDVDRFSSYGTWLEALMSGVLAGVALPLESDGAPVGGIEPMALPRGAPGFSVRTEDRRYSCVFTPDCEKIRSVSVTSPVDGATIFEAVFEDFDPARGIPHPGSIRITTPETGEELTIEFAKKRLNGMINDSEFSSVRRSPVSGN